MITVHDVPNGPEHDARTAQPRAGPETRSPTLTHTSPCGHERHFFDAQAHTCLLCNLLSAERDVTSLKDELDVAHEEAAKLMGELLAERNARRSTLIELGRANEQINSLRRSLGESENALEELTTSLGDAARAHMLKYGSLQDKFATLRTNEERASQLLKDVHAEGERLRTALDFRTQHISAELERLRGKVRFLETDNVDLSSEREALRERCELLDAHLATMTAQYETASVHAINLRFQLEEATQRWRGKVVDKNTDITASLHPLYGRCAPTVCTTKPEATLPAHAVGLTQLQQPVTAPAVMDLQSSRGVDTGFPHLAPELLNSSVAGSYSSEHSTTSILDMGTYRVIDSASDVGDTSVNFRNGDIDAIASEPSGIAHHTIDCVHPDCVSGSEETVPDRRAHAHVAYLASNMPLLSSRMPGLHPDLEVLDDVMEEAVRPPYDVPSSRVVFAMIGNVTSSPPSCTSLADYVLLSFRRTATDTTDPAPPMHNSPSISTAQPSSHRSPILRLQVMMLAHWPVAEPSVPARVFLLTSVILLHLTTFGLASWPSVMVISVEMLRLDIPTIVSSLFKETMNHIRRNLPSSRRHIYMRAVIGVLFAVIVVRELLIVAWWIVYHTCTCRLWDWANGFADPDGFVGGFCWGLSLKTSNDGWMCGTGWTAS